MVEVRGILTMRLVAVGVGQKKWRGPGRWRAVIVDKRRWGHWGSGERRLDFEAGRALPLYTVPYSTPPLRYLCLLSSQQRRYGDRGREGQSIQPEWCWCEGYFSWKLLQTLSQSYNETDFLTNSEVALSAFIPLCRFTIFNITTEILTNCIININTVLILYLSILML